MFQDQLFTARLVIRALQATAPGLKGDTESSAQSDAAALTAGLKSTSRI